MGRKVAGGGGLWIKFNIITSFPASLRSAAVLDVLLIFVEFVRRGVFSFNFLEILLS